MPCLFFLILSGMWISNDRNGRVSPKREEEYGLSLLLGEAFLSSAHSTSIPGSSKGIRSYAIFASPGIQTSIQAKTG